MDDRNFMKIGAEAEQHCFVIRAREDVMPSSLVGYLRLRQESGQKGYLYVERSQLRAHKTERKETRKCVHRWRRKIKNKTSGSD
jgi:hypothetical protein